MYQEWLIVFLEKPFTDQDSFVNEVFLFVDTDLSEGYVKLVELSSEFINVSCLKLKFDFTPEETLIARIIVVIQFTNLLK